MGDENTVVQKKRGFFIHSYKTRWLLFFIHALKIRILYLIHFTGEAFLMLLCAFSFPRTSWAAVSQV